MIVLQLTESDVRRMALDQSFQRGEEYYKTGSVAEIEQRGNTVTARVWGSQSDAYRVTVELGATGILSTRCSCPYDWGGICKHIVAALLTLLRKPAAVEKLVPLDELLAQRSKEDLIALVKEMVARQPDLARLLELPLHPASPVALDLFKFEKQVHYALSREDAEWAGRELQPLNAMADRYLAAGDGATAGSLYCILLEKVLVHFEGWWPEWDGNGDVSSAVSDCIEGLAVCLEKVADVKTRQPWLEVLLAAYSEDVRQGGIDYFGSADGHLLEQATDEEWRWIEKEVREEIDRRENWGRTTLVGFLTARLEMTGQENEADDFVLDHGTAEQRAYLLLNRGRIEEAIEVARQHFAGRPGLVIDFANRLEDAGHAEDARGYITEQVEDPYGSHYRLWLAAYYEEHGNLEAALALRQHEFEEEPRHEIYLTLQRLGQQTGVWEHLRPSLLARLDPQRHASLLITIFLDEGDVARAVEIVSRPRVYCDPGTLVRVAQAAEVEHPRAALKIYYHQAKRAIAGRSRATYAVAAEHLARVRELHRRLDEESLWQEYISRLRNEHRRLRALKEELDREGL